MELLDCAVCIQGFNSPYDTFIHLMTHLNKKTQCNYRCPYCEHSFKTGDKLKSHIMRHIQQHMYVCPFCGEGTSSEERLKKHIVIHIKDKTVSECVVCSKKFQSKALLKEHVRTHMQSDEPARKRPRGRPRGTLQMSVTEKQSGLIKRQHFCKFCKKEFLSGTFLKIHIQTHIEQEDTQDGENSSEISQRAPSGDGHNNKLRSMGSQNTQTKRKPRLRLQDQTDRKQFKCPVCKEGYTTKDDLKCHLKSHNKRGARSSECPVCSKMFRNNSHLNAHMKTHSADKKFVCTICGRKYWKEVQLKEHMDIHNGDKQHECSICQKRFRFSKTLAVHMTNHRTVGAHVCRQCYAEFPTAEELSAHLKRRKHSHQTADTSSDGSVDGDNEESENTDNDEPQFKCPYCAEGFTSLDLLDKHESNHPAGDQDTQLSENINSVLPSSKAPKVGETFVCTSCGKAFDRPDHLQVHMMSHVTPDSYGWSEYGNLGTADAQNMAHQSTNGPWNPLFTPPHQFGPPLMNHLGDTMGMWSDPNKVWPTANSMQWLSHASDKSHNPPSWPAGYSITSTTAQTSTVSNPIHESKKIPKAESSQRSQIKQTAQHHHLCTKCGKIYNKSEQLKVHLLNHKVEDDQKIKRALKLLNKPIGRPKKEESNEASRPGLTIKPLPQKQVADDYDKPYNCGECGKEFRFRSHLKIHEGTHLKHKDRQEKKQTEKETQQGSIYDFKIQITENGEKLYLCTVCGKGFSTEEFFQQHALLHVEKLHECELCFKRFKCLSYLKTHMVVHDDTQRTECPICKKLLSSVGNLRVHLKAVHSGEKPHTCKVCKKTYTTAGNLKVHMQNHTGEKPHVCLQCNQKFSTSAHLKRHMLSHTGERPYICEECGKQFIQNSQLRDHYANKHSGEKIHMCRICGINFSSTHALTRHTRIHTGERKFLCNICGKGVASTYHLKVHMRSHTGERPFTCQVCGKTYITPDSLKAHMKSHDGCDMSVSAHYQTNHIP